MSLGGHCVSSLKGSVNWGKFLVAGKRQMSGLSSRGRIQTTTGYSALSSFPRKQIFLEAISKEMKDKKVIGNSQHGFSKGKSCLSNLIAFCNEVTDSVEKWKAVHVVYLGFSLGKQMP